jgi:hypothetical protein
MPPVACPPCSALRQSRNAARACGCAAARWLPPRGTGPSRAGAPGSPPSPPAQPWIARRPQPTLASLRTRSHAQGWHASCRPQALRPRCRCWWLLVVLRAPGRARPLLHALLRLQAQRGCGSHTRETFPVCDAAEGLMAATPTLPHPLLPACPPSLTLSAPAPLTQTVALSAPASSSSSPSSSPSSASLGTCVTSAGGARARARCHQDWR